MSIRARIENGDGSTHEAHALPVEHVPGPSSPLGTLVAVIVNGDGSHSSAFSLPPTAAE